MKLDIPDPQIDLLMRALMQQPWGVVDPLIRHILPQLQPPKGEPISEEPK